ncbi:MAG TPA: hypothetical protein VFU22_22090 [Roseiflexaceae bacterium]|nr:hypothetical protein [Roseiflexaceae bacterium]
MPMYSIRTLASQLVPKLRSAASSETPLAALRRSRPWQLEAAFRRFQNHYPQYASTQALDALRATEHARLDRQAHVYLDYTGGGLYAESQLRDHMAQLGDQVFGNPHSENLTFLAMTSTIELSGDLAARQTTKRQLFHNWRTAPIIGCGRP